MYLIASGVIGIAGLILAYRYRIKFIGGPDTVRGGLTATPILNIPDFGNPTPLSRNPGVELNGFLVVAPQVLVFFEAYGGCPGLFPLQIGQEGESQHTASQPELGESHSDLLNSQGNSKCQSLNSTH